MLVEQRMAVTMEDLRTYKAYLEAPSDGVTPDAIVHAFSLFLSSQTAEGLAGLRASAEGRAPDDKLFDRLVNSSNFTFFAPGMIADIPCDPPVKPGALLMGVFRSIQIAVAGPLAGIAAAFPLILWLTIWYSILGLLATEIGLLILFLPHTWIGLIVLIPIK